MSIIATFSNNSHEQRIHYCHEQELIRSYIFDVTQRKRSEETLKYHAFHDSLTDLPNRSFFDECLSIALANAQINETLMAILFLDLDGFKNINYTLGHSIGDQILKCFASRLRAQLRGGDLLSRWGGDEFTILLPQIKNTDAPAKLAQRIFDNLKQPAIIDNHQIYLKSSIGISLFPQDAEDGETLLRYADIALYRTKEWGRNHYQFYNPSMTAEVSENFHLETRLHQAIEKEEFLLHYQPQININTGEISVMEALIRWQHPDLGLVSPGEFIPLAEKTGLIFPLNKWILKTACQQNKIWQQEGYPPIRIAVNLSAQQFHQPNFVALVEETLQLTGLDPQWLELEITESALMQNIELARQTLDQLRHQGVHISLDDFGTGYSCLGYLKQFPFQTLKIDQTFVKDLKDNPQDLAIVSAVIALSRGLNLRVVAEGIENQEQLELLKELQCEEMQGYLFSYPLSSEEALKFLTEHDQQR